MESEEELELSEEEELELVDPERLRLRGIAVGLTRDLSDMQSFSTFKLDFEILFLTAKYWFRKQTNQHLAMANSM